VTGCDAPEALEAAHIIAYQGQDTHHVTNGLLLRADLHTLFDFGLLAIDENTGEVLLAESLMDTTYATLTGSILQWPKREADRPNRAALAAHRREAGL
jgi:predicted restriction endonuclease